MKKLLWFVLALLGLGIITFIFEADTKAIFGIQDEKFFRILFYSIWLIILVPAILFSFSNKLGEATRNLALWLLIGLVLTASYLYRYELQDVANRLSFGLIEGSPLNATGKDGQITVTLQRHRSHSFIATGLVNGKKLTFIVDTGASITALRYEDAKRIGIDVDKLSFLARVSTANGVTQAAPTRVNTLSIGDISRQDVKVLVAQKGDLGHNLLGMNFFNRLSGLDIRADRLILHD